MGSARSASMSASWTLRPDAALSAQTGKTPRTLDARRIQNALKEKSVDLFGP